MGLLLFISATIWAGLMARNSGIRNADAGRTLPGLDPKDPITRYSEGKIPGSHTQYLDKNGLKVGTCIGAPADIERSPS